jgi:hypothetical protein
VFVEKITVISTNEMFKFAAVDQQYVGVEGHKVIKINQIRRHFSYHNSLK